VSADASPEVVAAVDELNVYLRAHAGSVELIEQRGNTVRLRYDGLCAGCMFRPVTTAATLRPMMKQRFGLDVEVVGGRISEEAEARLAGALAGTGMCPAPASEPPER
jgi:Fe-S cluster biogenesis protein NfuA